MAEKLFDIAVKFFGNLEQSPEGKQELKRYNRRVEFEVKDSDSEAFFLDVADGKLTVKNGKLGPTTPEPLHFIAYRDLLIRLFQGKVRFADAYSGQVDRDPEREKKALRVRESKYGEIGGVIGGCYVNWVGKLIRMGQDLR